MKLDYPNLMLQLLFKEVASSFVSGDEQISVTPVMWSLAVKSSTECPAPESLEQGGAQNLL